MILSKEKRGRIMELALLNGAMSVGEVALAAGLSENTWGQVLSYFNNSGMTEQLKAAIEHNRQEHKRKIVRSCAIALEIEKREEKRERQSKIRSEQAKAKARKARNLRNRPSERLRIVLSGEPMPFSAVQDKLSDLTKKQIMNAAYTLKMTHKILNKKQYQRHLERQQKSPD